MSDKINWKYVEHRGKKDGYYAVWKPYGIPEIIDPFKSVFADVEVMPKWPVPEKVAISAAMTGAFFGQNDNPDQLVDNDSILQSADECLAAGATTVHLHARDENGFNVLDADAFQSIVDPLREKYPSAMIDGCMVATRQEEWDNMNKVLERKTLDAVPVNTLAAFNGDSMFVKPPHVMIEKTRRIQEAGLKVELAVYTDADIDNAKRYLIDSGLLQKPYTWIILPALPGCSPMHNPRQMVNGLMRMVEVIYDIDEDSRIMVAGAGRASSYLTMFAMILGLHVRVGMEDTVWKWPHRDDLIKSNLEQLEAAKLMAKLAGREVMTQEEYADWLGVERRKAKV
ncbi:3-keto-5-aminohexanoate cleavage protein [Sporosarcina sp. P1]|uniref:3-keto-5-aminohexanoate cleavage protein n=1 Tax=Sporosarcina sp. P1 TaxID=2048257 RepID=UPI000C16A889|nr:3-keto-5-aminohexanoate cleavage protein [Sporosarcina sp. P1]PIC82997.1 3-keto-5-aminohexanoate cleavage protein [Sporosarcina sp. P1]